MTKINLVEKSPDRALDTEPKTPQSFKKVVSTKPLADQPKQVPLRLGSIGSSKVELPPQAVDNQHKPIEIIRAYPKYGEAPERPAEPEAKQQPEQQPTKPRVVEHLKNHDLIEGGQVCFECRFQGHPLNIQWFKGDYELRNQYRHKISYDEKTGKARLFISTVLEEDADVYTCRAYNSLGEAVTSAKLSPLGTFSFKLI